MCVLCSEFIHQVHWTDYTSNTKDEMTVGEAQRTHKRSRLRRVELCNKILKHFRLKLEDWQGSKFILSDAKGNSIIVHDLAALWNNVEKMLGYPINPLDDELLVNLTHQD
ncbi:hypothetical protein [Metabacillus litoralis]|uniref:hypothetical protein n=1 Tax=Metabacillus litoralis TaxID=152268 RepID=UPI0020406FC9|nr:hypothetical protein [Metabacillus litoralis]MCM3162244.1 hypothetical protein [Metabacillus litoralis]